MVRVSPVVVLLAVGTTLAAAQRPSDDNAFPHTKPNGRAVEQDEGASRRVPTLRRNRQGVAAGADRRGVARAR